MLAVRDRVDSCRYYGVFSSRFWYDSMFHLDWVYTFLGMVERNEMMCSLSYRYDISERGRV